MDTFWYITDIEGDKVIFYVENYKKLNIKLNPMASYIDKKGKLVALQYIVRQDSDDFKKIKKQLKLTDKERLIERRLSKKNKKIAI